MNNRSLDSFDAAEPGSLADELDRPIEALDTISRRSGTSTLGHLAKMGKLLLKLGQALLRAVEFWLVILCLPIVPALIYYWKSDDVGILDRIVTVAACLTAVSLTLRISVRSHDRDALRSLLLDFGNLLVNKRLNKDAASYKYLSNSYKSGQVSRVLNKPTDTIQASARCLSESTSRIRERYQSHCTAADWLCVMFSSQSSSLFSSDQFGSWLLYFHGFDRRMKPTDRIVRVFSTPVTFAPTPKGPSWGENSLDEAQRFRLLSYLFINRAVGVETKLHCFDPLNEDNSDFFHEADYVLVRDPAQEKEEEDQTLFIAIPGDERKCLQLKGRTIWSAAFEFEFYNRLSRGHGARECDCIMDATTEKAADLINVLRLRNIKGRWAEVSKAILDHDSKFSAVELLRLQKRWDAWFP